MDQPRQSARSHERSRKTFVLVHGAWHGGWCWRRVADRLTAQGQKVFTPTMTGVGERVHLSSRSVNLETQIMDIVNVIKWENLDEIVLIGHSYGGCVITGVAEQMAPTISSIVYLDAFMPENGQSLADTLPPSMADTANAYRKQAEDGVPTPPIPAAAFNVNPKNRVWVDGKCTPHPASCFVQKLTLTGARDRIAKKTFILATGWDSPFKFLHDKFKANPAWQTYEVACGHDVMVDKPERLTEILLKVA
jgi:pimeloyl-ACP methyl ester carboxylesterase